MATTNYSKNVVGGLPQTARFDVTADNDIILQAGNYLIIGAYFNDTVTALNVAGGADKTAYPFQTVNQTVCVTTAGAGSVTVVFVELPTAGYDTITV